MGNFFIDRPVFAWVIAFFILMLGALSLTKLPIAQYPPIAPPTIVVSAAYPGASAEVIDESVTSLIEQQLNGAQGIQYIESQSQANGTLTVTATFDKNIAPDLAQVDVQNRLKAIEARLPQAVLQQGLMVNQSRSNFLLFITLLSTDGKRDPVALGDYLSRNIINDINRVPGVGQAVLFGTERAMRIWLDPDKLFAYQLAADEVISAVQNQNTQVAGGIIGDLPNSGDNPLYASIVVPGQLSSEKAFGDIVLRANPDGSTVRLRDVARIAVGGQDYGTSARLNGKPMSAIGVQLSTTGNALQTATLVREKMEELSRYFPPGVGYEIPYDTSKFVKISIQEVVKTLGEAMILVFLVMWLFLQNLRSTLIPTLVVPVALMGTFVVMYVLGFSVNVLTMFGMTLAVGIVVDDAIVVVENVERLMHDQGLSPREATHQAMGQITNAIIGITLVLMAVFVPMAFFSGAVGTIYQQFSLSMVSSIAFSALMALTLTPALCATLLRPVHKKPQGFAAWFNRFFDRGTNAYAGMVARSFKKTGRYLLLYLAILLCVGWMYHRLPSAFLPNEDQGYLITNIELPAGASSHRTLEVVKEVEKFFLDKKDTVAHVVSVLGFSFSGNGQNAALAFVPLKDWSERKRPDQSAQALAGAAFGYLMKIKDAIVFPLSPPPIPELGNATGFTLRLQDRGNIGHAALKNAQNQLLGLAAKSKILTGVRPEGLQDAPQLLLNIDREKSQALGVTYGAIRTALSAAFSSVYVNDFPNQGRLQRVIVQAEAEKRLQPDDVLRLFAKNAAGNMVPFSAFMQTEWTVGPVQMTRYNGYPAMKISGGAAPGYSTGQAMAEIETLIQQLPPGVGYAWTGQSLEEKVSGAQAPLLYGLSLIVVFLVLAALYESTAIPFAVMLVVPLGIIGALLGVTLRGMPDDVYFKVGMIAIVGLSAKNAILIVEFAKELYAQGMGLYEACAQAAKLRFRPILMTSLAFTLGVLPLALATGAGSASRRAIGTGVIGGMITATVFSVIFVPLFFVLVQKVAAWFGRARGGPSLDP